jgi:hypothetical protein
MTKPWTTRQEMLTDLALESAISDPETIRQTRPVVPQVLFPERLGFAKQEHNIFSVLNTSRQGAPSYRYQVCQLCVRPLRTIHSLALAGTQ